MKPQRRIKMPLRRPPQRPRPSAGTKMRAKAATVEEGYDEEDDYEDEEPNMKFSHALLVVLILHVIAVGGVFAFNSIKAKQTNEKATAKTSEVVESGTQGGVVSIVGDTPVCGHELGRTMIPSQSDDSRPDSP